MRQVCGPLPPPQPDDDDSEAANATVPLGHARHAQAEDGVAAARVPAPLEPVEVVSAGRRLAHLAARGRRLAALLSPGHGTHLNRVVGVRLQEVEPKKMEKKPLRKASY